MKEFKNTSVTGLLDLTADRCSAAGSTLTAGHKPLDEPLQFHLYQRGV